MEGNELTTVVIAIIAVIGIVELALVVWALVDLIRRPATSLLPRWGWVIAILVFNLLGSALYLLLGRSQPPRASDRLARGGARDERMRDAVDILYEPQRPSARDDETRDGPQ